MMNCHLVDGAKRDNGFKSNTYGKKELPDPTYFRFYLHFLAKTLEKSKNTEFMIERLQPEHLSAKYQKKYRKTFRLLVSILFSLFPLIAIGWIIAPLLIQNHPDTGKAVLGFLMVTLAYMFLGYLVSSMGLELNTPPIERIKFVPSEFMIEAVKNLKYLYVCLPVCIFGLSFLFQSWPAGITITLIIIPFAWLIVSFSHSSIHQAENIVRPNQGIKQTGKTLAGSFFVSLVLIFVHVFSLSAFLPIIMNDEEKNFVITISSILIISLMLIFGGASALLKHWALRLVLIGEKLAPFRYDRLLNYAAERRILQRVGGRYRFIHKLLQDHFAAMELDSKR